MVGQALEALAREGWPKHMAQEAGLSPFLGDKAR